MRAVAAGSRTVIHQHRLDRAGEGFGAARGQTVDRAIEILDRGTVVRRRLADDRFGRLFEREFESLFQQRDPRVERIVVHRGGQRQRGLFVQLLTQTPIGQFQALLHFARLDQRPPVFVAIEQRRAAILDLAAFDVDLAAGHPHVVAIAGQQDIAGHELSVAEQQDAGLGAQRQLVGPDPRKQQRGEGQNQQDFERFRHGGGRLAKPPAGVKADGAWPRHGPAYRKMGAGR